MRGGDFADNFKEVTNLVNNPFAQAGLQHASSMYNPNNLGSGKSSRSTV